MTIQDFADRIEVHFTKNKLTPDIIEQKIGQHLRFFAKNFRCKMSVEVLETETFVHLLITEVRE